MIRAIPKLQRIFDLDGVKYLALAPFDRHAIGAMIGKTVGLNIDHHGNGTGTIDHRARTTDHINFANIR